MKVLIIKLRALGDVVMALPMNAAVRSLDPNASITWLCGQAVAPLLKAVGGIDELLVVDERRLLLGSQRERVSELFRIWYKLLGRRFDLVLSANRDFRYGLLSITALASERRSLKKRRGRQGVIPGRYQGDEYARLVTNRDGPREQGFGFPQVRLELPAELALRLRNLPRPVVALAPGGASNFLRDQPLKRWPLDSYVLLAQRILERGAGVVLTGGSSDHWASGAFEGLATCNLIGETSVTDLLALYGWCEAVVTHDSGPLHIAVLAGTPLVALFGPTNPSEFLPPSRKIRALWGGKELACSPCYDGSRAATSGADYAECGNNVCMRSISVNAVLRALDELLGTDCSASSRASSFNP
jgi:lipopolysaccharide heptosyltransferase II